DPFVGEGRGSRRNGPGPGRMDDRGAGFGNSGRNYHAIAAEAEFDLRIRVRDGRGRGRAVDGGGERGGTRPWQGFHREAGDRTAGAAHHGPRRRENERGDCGEMDRSVDTAAQRGRRRGAQLLFREGVGTPRAETL